LSDIDIFDDDQPSASDKESERKVQEKMTGLCFFADSTHGGFCTMALGDGELAAGGEAPEDDPTLRYIPVGYRNPGSLSRLT